MDDFFCTQDIFEDQRTGGVGQHLLANWPTNFKCGIRRLKLSGKVKA